VETLRRFAHAADLHHRHEDVEVVKLHTASDAIAQMHACSHLNLDMATSYNGITCG
jgi:hypothetical protein